MICTHPAVADVAVVGIEAGEDVGEVPKAYVVPKPNVRLNEEDITKFVEGKKTYICNVCLVFDTQFCIKGFPRNFKLKLSRL